MNKRIIALIVLITIVLLAIVFFAFRAFNDRENPNEFVLVSESGIISFKKETDSDYQKLNAVELTLASGSFVKTEAESYAKVFLADGSMISLDQSTEIQVNLQNENVNINQLVGNTWNRVQTVLNGKEYTIETPNTIAAVRGTTFGVSVIDKDNTTTFVEESKVEVNRYEIADGDKKVLETTELLQDEMADVIKDQTSFRIVKGKTRENLKNSFWFKRNKIIDEIFKNLKGTRGKELRLKLLRQLITREDFKTFRFGLNAPADTTEEDINSKLAEVQDITKINEETCSTYTFSDFQLASDKLSAYKDYISNYDDINDLIERLKNSCRDGALSLSESEELRTLVSEINN